MTAPPGRGVSLQPPARVMGRNRAPGGVGGRAPGSGGNRPPGGVTGGTPVWRPPAPAPAALPSALRLAPRLPPVLLAVGALVLLGLFLWGLFNSRRPGRATAGPTGFDYEWDFGGFASGWVRGSQSWSSNSVWCGSGTQGPILGSSPAPGRLTGQIIVRAIRVEWQSRSGVKPCGQSGQRIGARIWGLRSTGWVMETDLLASPGSDSRFQETYSWDAVITGFEVGGSGVVLTPVNTGSDVGAIPIVPIDAETLPAPAPLPLPPGPSVVGGAAAATTTAAGTTGEATSGSPATGLLPGAEPVFLPAPGVAPAVMPLPTIQPVPLPQPLPEEGRTPSRPLVRPGTTVTTGTGVTNAGQLPAARPLPVPTTPADQVVPWPGAQPIPGTPNSPPATLTGIATVVGQIERKIDQAMSNPEPPSSGESPVNLLQGLGQLLQLLFSADGPGEYAIDSPCEVNSEGNRLPARTAAWGASLGVQGAVVKRLDALAELLQHHKDLKQPGCKGPTPAGEVVTVQFEEQ